MADETFEGNQDVAEKTYPIRAGEVKKGMIVMLKGFPCKVVEVTTSKTGKHGHAKANITGLDIFTSKKYQDISPTSHNMVAPVVANTHLTLTDIQDGFVTVMNDNGEIREDLKLPDGELGEKLTTLLAEDDKEITVVVTKAMDTECITTYKVSSD